MRIDTFQCNGNALVDRPVEATSLRARSDLMIGIREEIRHEPADVTALRLELSPGRPGKLLEGQVSCFTLSKKLTLTAAW